MMALFVVVSVGTLVSFFFFFNDTATTEIYTLSLHDALPILASMGATFSMRSICLTRLCACLALEALALKRDRKSTRLNSSHQIISYAVFCLKKKITTPPLYPRPSPAVTPTLPPHFSHAPHPP